MEHFYLQVLMHGGQWTEALLCETNNPPPQ